MTTYGDQEIIDTLESEQQRIQKKKEKRRAKKRKRMLNEYDKCFQRWVSLNTQVWQVPAMAMASQAFLFTVMLSSTTATLPRIATAALAVVVNFSSAHVMLKHRYHQSIDYGRMVQIEKRLRLSNVSYGGWFSQKWAKEIDALLPGKSRLQRHKLPGSSVTVWLLGLSLFAIAAIGVIVVAIWFPHLFKP